MTKLRLLRLASARPQEGFVLMSAEKVWVEEGLPAVRA